MQRVALALVLVVSGCVAHAASPEGDRLVLKDGRVVAGEVTATGDGAYTVRLPDGTEERYAYAEIDKVERTRAERFDSFKAGFEITGLGLGPRLSFEREHGIVDSFGVRGGIMLMPIADYPYATVWAAAAVDWLDESPVKIETTAGLYTTFYYVGFLGGVAARVSPPDSFVRMNVGLFGSVDTNLYYPSVFPDVSVSVLW